MSVPHLRHCCPWLSYVLLTSPLSCFVLPTAFVLFHNPPLHHIHRRMVGWLQLSFHCADSCTFRPHSATHHPASAIGIGFYRREWTALATPWCQWSKGPVLGLLLFHTSASFPNGIHRRLSSHSPLQNYSFHFSVIKKNNSKLAFFLMWDFQHVQISRLYFLIFFSSRYLFPGKLFFVHQLATFGSVGQAIVGLNDIYANIHIHVAVKKTFLPILGS